MAWCFSTRASVAAVLSTHPYVSSCLAVDSNHAKFIWGSIYICASYHFSTLRQSKWFKSSLDLGHIFTRGQFWPSGIVIACVCVCVCPCVCVCVSLCVNHLLVRAITRDPFKLGSPNLDQRCKRPWLRSLLFLGVIDLDLQGQI